MADPGAGDASHRGWFVTVEGIEGAGKSTQIERLRDRLEAAGHPVTTTREPGGTAVGERLRDLLLSRDGPPIAPDTELLLMFAARAQHLSEVVNPALAAGRWVLCDRFTDATYAYQGGGRGIPADRVEILERWVQGDLRPDRTVLLDLPPAVGARRAEARGEMDRFDQETVAFLERVRDAYRDRAGAEPRRFVVVDATATVDRVTDAILRGLEDRR